MLRKIMIVISIIVTLIVLALWSPWRSVDFSLLESLGLRQKDEYAGLQVYSTSGELVVLVDNELVGSIDVEGSPLDIFNVEPGDHIVTVKRPGYTEQIPKYFEFSRLINFTKGVNVVIAYEIGPTEKFSNGYVISAIDSISEEDNYLNIRTNPEEATVYINGNEMGSSPVTNFKLDLNQTYKVIIELDGVEDMEFDLLPEETLQREALKPYDLNVEVNLMYLPIEIKQTSE